MGVGTYACLSDLRLNLEYPTATTTHDTRLRLVLEAVSRDLDEWCGRHFYTINETRYFDGRAGTARVVDQYSERLTEYRANLWVDDILAVTSIGMDSDGDAAWEDTLVATDYILHPWNTWPKTRIDLDLRQGDYTYWPMGQQSVKVVGTWGYGDGQSASPWYTTALTATVANGTSTSITVSAATGLSAGQTWLIESEQVYVESIPPASTTAVVVRGVNGTTGAAHAAQMIKIAEYPGQIEEACLLQSQRFFLRRTAPFGVAGAADMGQTSVRIPGLDPDVKHLVQAFRRSIYKGAM